MLKTTSFLISGFAAIICAACATQTYEPICKSADWESLGYRYVQGNANVESGDFYRRVCANFGYEADIEAYERGYFRGAEKFCTPIRGFKNGSNATQNENVCAAVESADYDAAYADGVKVSEIELSLEKLSDREGQIEVEKFNMQRASLRLHYNADSLEMNKILKGYDQEGQDIYERRKKLKAQLKLIKERY